MRTGTSNSGIAINLFPDDNEFSSERSRIAREKANPEAYRPNSSPSANFVSVQATGGNETTRGGFNLSDFSGSEDESPKELSSAHEEESRLFRRISALDIFSHRAKLYGFIESTTLTGILVTILFLDGALFGLSYLSFLRARAIPSLDRASRIMDWIAAILYFVEVNARLYCYGFSFYFRSALRIVEYFASITNSIFFICTLFSSAKWLLITRLTRLLRFTTVVTSWRERQVKLKARGELEEVAKTLERDGLVGRGLTKWKLHSEDIAAGERVGHGGFGTVFSGLFRGTLVAIKQIPAAEREESLSSIEEEAITLVNLRHPNVVLFMGFVCEPSKLWIVTEYCSRGSLRDVLDNDEVRMTEGRLLKIALGAARGLAYLHGQNPPVLHLDLKTSNVLISSGWDAKLGDFGLSRNVTNIERDCFGATMQYCAPEILEANKFSTAADVYSFGVCLWELATREVPFEDRSPTSVLWGVVKSNLRPPIDAILIKEREKSKTLPLSTAVVRTAVEAELRFDDLTNNLKHAERTDMATADSRGITDVQHLNLALELKSDATDVDTPSIPELSPNPFQKVDLQMPREVSEPSREEQSGVKVIAEAKRAPNNIVDPLHDENDAENVDEDPVGLISILRPYRSSKLSSTGQSSQLADLSRRVTATIRKLDDRPPIARRKEIDLLVEEKRDEKDRTDDEDVPVPAMTFATMIKQTFRSRLNLKDTISAASAEPVSQQTVGESEVLQPLSYMTSNSEAFARRMENFARSNGGPSERSKAHRELCASRNSSRRKATVEVRSQYVHLIQKCWAQDPERRPSASQVVWELVSLIKEIG